MHGERNEYLYTQRTDICQYGFIFFKEMLILNSIYNHGVLHGLNKAV